MKQVSILFVMLALFSCKQQPDKITQLEQHIDSLEIKLANAYKPGFGELMNSIQLHHSKLWFAGQHQNWELAKFEVHELEEIFEDIIKYQTERKESKQIEMIYPDLDSVSLSIERKNNSLFKRTYAQLTNTCNNCHRLNEHGYIVSKIPGISPYSNQDFSTNIHKTN